MDWWDAFSFKEFFFYPTRYLPPNVDRWIRDWGTWLDLFVQTNPWFFGFLTGTGLSWATWVVMKTPWNWDNTVLGWFKEKVLKQPSESKVVKRKLSDIVDVGPKEPKL